MSRPLAAEFKGPNAESWQQKIWTNRSRDRSNDGLQTAAGWTVIRVSECEIRRDPGEAAARRAGTARKTPDQDAVEPGRLGEELQY
jgi:G:T-mismatch repair DNA endonuclease (very short patch repair protein)